MRPDALILAVDQSTAGTKAILFDRTASIVHKILIPHKQYYPAPGYVEHDPEELIRNVERAAVEVVAASGVDWVRIAAIALTNQRETVFVWDKPTGRPIYNAIVWQDGRAAELCDKLSGQYDYLRDATGLEPSPFFSAPKIAWILENVPGARERADRGELAFGTVESFVLSRLTGGRAHKCDATNASRTLLMNLDSMEWDRKAFDIFNIPIAMAPEIVHCDKVCECTSAFGSIPSGIPIAAMIGDSHGALFGQSCFSPGDVKVTYGTGSSIMMNTGAARAYSTHGLVSSVAYAVNNQVSYCLEGNINTTGGIIKWMHEKLGILPDPSMSGNIAASVSDNGGVYLVPALAGLAAPYWRSDVRASFTGMSSFTTAAHLIRAGEEAIAYQITDVVRAMEEDTDAMIANIRADGGPVKDGFLMDFQAGMLCRDVSIASIQELSALGAAFIAGLTVGIWKDCSEIRDLCPPSMVYPPRMDADAAARLYEGWIKAVHTVIS